MKNKMADIPYYAIGLTDSIIHGVQNAWINKEPNYIAGFNYGTQVTKEKELYYDRDETFTERPQLRRNHKDGYY